MRVNVVATLAAHLFFEGWDVVVFFVVITVVFFFFFKSPFSGDCEIQPH